MGFMVQFMRNGSYGPNPNCICIGMKARICHTLGPCGMSGQRGRLATPGGFTGVSEERTGWGIN